MSKFKNRTDKKFLLKKVLNYIDDHLSKGYISYADADVLKEIEETNKSEKLCDDEIEKLTGKLEDVNLQINNAIEKVKNDIFLSGIIQTSKREKREIESNIRKKQIEKKDIISERENLMSVFSLSANIKKTIRKNNIFLYLVFPISLFSVIIAYFYNLNHPNHQIYILMLSYVSIMSISFPLIRNYFKFGVFIVSQGMSVRFALNEVSTGISDISVDNEINNTIPTNSDDEKISYYKNFDMIFDLTRKRLKKEILEITRRNDTNLIIGIIASLCAIGTLSIAIFYPDDTSKLEGIHFFSHIIMRISIGIFIEIFAYFFLKLYKNGLDEMRYYQNEITNIDMKWSALHVALQPSENEFIEEPIKNLSSTERNFILKKGETTIGLEKDKLEKNEVVDIVKETLRLFRRVKK